jgi:site-specific DNA recombinase
VRLVQAHADRLGLRSKTRKSGEGAITKKPFTRGHIYKLLSNPIYIGRVHHAGQYYEGEHEGIVDLVQWEKVQAGLRANAALRGDTVKCSPSLLTGIVFDDHGRRLTPSFTRKGTKRYRYYIGADEPEGARASSRCWRVNAEQLEAVVMGNVNTLVTDPAALRGSLGQANVSDSQITELLSSTQSSNHRTIEPSNLRRAEGRCFAQAATASRNQRDETAAHVPARGRGAMA